MQGKICMVTGATFGIGKATAEGLAAMGATVIVVGRNKAKGEDVIKEITQKTGNKDIHLLIADLSSQAAIRQLAQDFKSQFQKLHVLVNNVGAVYTSRQTSVDGYELTFALNHLGYFLLTNLLLDVIKASAPARIVNVSSQAHSGAHLNFDDLMNEKSYAAMRVYGQSKLANILFSNELAQRLAGTGVTVNSLHPGVVASGFGMNNGGLIKVAMGVLHLFTISNEQGAETSIFLASSPSVEGVTGKYFDKKKAVEPSAEAQDMQIAKHLWEVSEKLTHLVPEAQSV